MVIRLLREIGRRVDDLSGNVNKEIGSIKKDVERRTSSQDGGVGRHTVPPHTTKRRTTTI